MNDDEELTVGFKHSGEQMCVVQKIKLDQVSQ